MLIGSNVSGEILEHWWVVRDSLSNLQTNPFDPISDISVLDSSTTLGIARDKSRVLKDM